ncbi:hypothetical protein IJU85_01740 [Candidatus Saccharibacteria bacterium]|nr:hypothetical protein [Candidatus Saccharibacteria bacterium]
MDQNENLTPPIDTPTPVEAPAPAPEAPQEIPTPQEAPAPQPVPELEPAKKSKGLIVLSVITTVLAVAGVAFGVYFFIDSNNKSTENANLRTKIALLNTETETELEEDTLISTTETSSNKTTVTIAEAEKLLEDKFDFKGPYRPMFDGWYRYVEKFDQSSKILFTIYHNRDKFSLLGQDSSQTISYDVLNSSYIYYFGDKEPLEKKSYTLDSNAYLNEIIYHPETDNFSVTFPDGIGGTTPELIYYKVAKTIATNDGFNAIVVSAYTSEADMDPPAVLSAYEFKFVKEDNEYKLTSIEKL